MAREVEERNIQFIQSMFAATGADDWETAETMVTEDFFITEAACLPFGGVFRGIPGMRQLYALVMSSLGVSAIDIGQITAGGNWVAVFAEFRLEGTDAKVSLVETFCFRDGRVCEIKPYYFDHAPIWDAYNARKQATSS